MNTSNLYDLAEENKIEVIQFDLRNCESVSIATNGDYYIGIDKNINKTADEKVHLAHELGHCITGAFYNEYSDNDIRERAEYKANKWAILRLVPKKIFIDLLKKGYKQWELAEYFEVTEDFIKKAFHLYCEVKMI